VTSYLYPLSVSGSIQAHIVSLDWLNSLPEADRIAFEADLKQMEEEMWDLALTTNDTAQSCSTGGNCPEGGLYTSYDMKLVSVSDADKAKVAEISATKVLPEWAAKCNANYPDCSKIWNETVGAARGIVIE
jgi:hypothetical protein